MKKIKDYAIDAIEYVFEFLERYGGEISPTPPSYTDQEVQVFFRDLKLKILIEGDLKPDINKLSKKEINYLQELSNKGMVITGSHVLRMYGLLDRKSGDVDAFYDIKTAKEMGMITNDNKINSTIDDYDQDKDLKERIKIDHSGNQLDMFDSTSFIDEETIETGGIIHCHYLNILTSKLKYHREKDREDFVVIKNKLGLS
jgi:hypothetical protein